MIIYNTTFHVATDVKEQFLEWIKQHYIPAATSSGHLKKPQLALIMARNEGDDGDNYSMQFQVESVDALEQWYKTSGAMLLSPLGTMFGQKVAGFSTIMSVIVPE